MATSQPAAVAETQAAGSVRVSAYATTEDLHRQVIDLAGSKDLEVDLSGLASLDASALQVLLALASEQTERGLGLQVRHVSPALGQWLESSGAGPHLPQQELKERG
ncbi:STAS domain-containing protein [Silvibacterium sp.]|uniref:STAS domain-containing protein n=1 Tax=Silvibacterium sp. TaxID=1964179 RepID=UPI0039E39B95